MALDNMRLSSIEELKTLSAAVHDWYFDVDAVRVDDAERTVAIRLEPSKQELSAPRGRGMVVSIRKVVSLRVVDTERIGLYDIYELLYEHPFLRIITNIPLTLEVEVANLEIDVDGGAVVS